MMETKDLDERILSAFSEFDLGKHCVLAAYMGSVSHNTYLPPTHPDSTDDVDILGVVIPPPRYIIGLANFDHWTYTGLIRKMGLT